MDISQVSQVLNDRMDGLALLLSARRTAIEADIAVNGGDSETNELRLQVIDALDRDTELFRELMEVKDAQQD